MQIIDLSDPYDLELVSTYGNGVMGCAPFVVNHHVYLSYSEEKLWIGDVSDPAHPSFEDDYYTNGAIIDNFVVGDYVFVADGSSFLILRYDVPTEIESATGKLPGRFAVSENYPNPFNANTTLRYSMPETNQITLSIYNLLGQRVATVFEAVQEAGEHSVTWDASDFPSGVYFARLEAGGKSENVKMVLVK